MSHNYDDLVVITDEAADYWRLDTQVDEEVNKAKSDITISSSGTGGTPTNLISGGTNNLYSNYFNGTSDYITATTSEYVDYTYKVSVECWIKPSSDQSATDFVGLVNKPGSFGLCLNYGKLAFYTCDTFSSTKRIVGSSSAVSSGDVYHVVGTYDGQENNATKLYVNGSLVASSSDYSGEIAQNASNLTIGSWDTSVLFFNGYISNVALYGFELSSTQVSNHAGYTG